MYFTFIFATYIDKQCLFNNFNSDTCNIISKNCEINENTSYGHLVKQNSNIYFSPILYKYCNLNIY